MACATSSNSCIAAALRSPLACLPEMANTTSATATGSATCCNSYALSLFTAAGCYPTSRGARRAHLDHYAGAVLAVERLRAAAVELGDQAHDVQAEAQMRLARAIGVAHRHHRFELLARHRLGQARAAA